MKKLLTLFPALLMIAWLGCGDSKSGPTPTSKNGTQSKKDTSPNPAKPKGLIAYTPLTLSNPFFKVIGDHIKAEAGKNGYETIIVDPDMDVKKQSDQIDDFISREVTAIILVPCDRLTVGPAVKEANKAGIPVFTVDAKCAAKGVEIEGHVGTDNFQGGELAGQAMIKALGDKGGKVLVLDFKKAHSCVLRVGGFKKVINAYNKGRETGKIIIVSELDGAGERTKGYQSTADALQAHEDLDAIFAINDPSALGAWKAIDEANKVEQITIVGFDGAKAGKQAILEGKIYADPIQYPVKMGREIMAKILAYQNGEDFETLELIPTTLYRKSDAEKDPELQP